MNRRANFAVAPARRTNEAGQRATAFLRLEDADGIVDVIVPREAYAACRAAMRSPLLIVEGRLQKRQSTPVVVAEGFGEVEARHQAQAVR